jgi:phosphoserine phosphatase RsbU/P
VWRYGRCRAKVRSSVTSAPGESSIDDLLAWLLAKSRPLPPAELSVAVAEALERVGVRSSCMFLADRDHMSLNPFGPGAAAFGAFGVDGTIGGRAYALETTLTVPTADGARMWVPLIDGTARVGLLCIDVDTGDESDNGMKERVERVASLAAELIVTKHQYTDVIELARRHQPMSLEAELQRSNLPPVALITPQVAVAGILLPAYEVAGDSFDYALNAGTLDVAVIDSVGHELESSLISHLVQGSLRNSRRNGLDLPEAYAAADAAVARIFPDLRFATAAFGRLDLSSGRFRWISAGHPPVILARDGKVLGEVPTVPVLPIGLGGEDAVVNEVVLGAGDILLLYTDGVTEGGARGAERFGLDRLAELLGRGLLAGLPPAEMLRRLVSAVLQHSSHQLRDDATLLLVEHRGPRSDPPAITTAADARAAGGEG